MVLINLETSLSTSHFRAKAQRSKNSKMDSKMESWLWRFMENLGIEGYALWSHNFSSYTLHKTYTIDTQQNRHKSCAPRLKTKTHILAIFLKTENEGRDWFKQRDVFYHIPGTSSNTFGSKSQASIPWNVRTTSPCAWKIRSSYISIHAHLVSFDIWFVFLIQF